MIKQSILRMRDRGCTNLEIANTLRVEYSYVESLCGPDASDGGFIDVSRMSNDEVRYMNRE